MKDSFDNRRALCMGKLRERLVRWIQNWFAENGENCNAVIGISGGKDSSVAAALCVEALGKDRVFGVMMPNLHQSDLQDSIDLAEFLSIRYKIVPITEAVHGVLSQMELAEVSPSDQTKINLPARIRMATLYAVSQSVNGRVVNTCNLSEDWIGYSTRRGDSVGDFCPLAKLTAEEVQALGLELGLPERLVLKTPSDGLCGKTDEDNLGFTYAVLDRYIRTGFCDDPVIKDKIDRMHKSSSFKLKMPPHFESYLPEVPGRVTRVSDMLRGQA